MLLGVVLGCLVLRLCGDVMFGCVLCCLGMRLFVACMWCVLCCCVLMCSVCLGLFRSDFVAWM